MIHRGFSSIIQYLVLWILLTKDIELGTNERHKDIAFFSIIPANIATSLQKRKHFQSLFPNANLESSESRYYFLCETLK